MSVDLTEKSIKDHPATADLRNLLADADYTGAGLENNLWARHDRFLREFAPRILEEIDGPKYSCVEIGCGVGSVTQAFANIFKQATAFEIDKKLVNIVNQRASLFGLDNLSCQYVPPESIVAQAVAHANGPTVYMLYAVLEHMTEQERLQALTTIWNAMKKGDYLYIGNTPNRLSYQDLHTHETPFLIGLPDHTALNYLAIRPEIRLRDYLLSIERKQGFDAFCLARRRKGLGVSFHDFQIAFSDFDLNCPNLQLVYELILTCHLVAFFISEGIDVPVCFALRDMNFLIKKSKREERKTFKERNAQARHTFELTAKSVLAKFATT